MIKGARRHISVGAAICLLVAAAAPLQAASPSELLEQGIYAEETTGDLDKAVDIYRKIVAEADEVEAIAAQALLRMGICLNKQGKHADAQTVFKSLLEKYPEQEEQVRVARTYLDEAVTFLPAPWKNGEHLTLKMTMGVVNVGLVGTSVSQTEVDGQPAWKMSVRRFTGEKNQGVSNLVIDAATNRPLSGRFDHTLFGNSEASWSPDKLVITNRGNVGVSTTDTTLLESAPRKPAAKDPAELLQSLLQPPARIAEIALSEPAYSNDQMMFGFRQLPLKVGYKATIPIRVEFTGGNLIPLSVHVDEMETVETPVGTFNCFKLVLSDIQQTFWIADNPERYLVRFDAGGVTALLTDVNNGSAQEVSNEPLGFSATVPAGWFQASFPDATGTIGMIASDMAGALIRVQMKEGLATELRSLPEWKKDMLGRIQFASPQTKVVAEEDGEVTLAGLPAVTFTLEEQQGNRMFRRQVTLAMSDDRAIRIDCWAGSQAFPKNERAFQSIRDSFKLTALK